MSPFKRRRLREDLGSIDRPIWAETTSMMQKLEAQLARLDIQEEETTTAAATTIADAHLNLEDRPFRFLDLPAELRNATYVFALADYPTRLSEDGMIQTGYLLIHASRQVNSELKSLLITDAPSLQIAVRDFNFSHVISFFDGLSDIDLKNIMKSSDAGEGTIRIQLTFTSPEQGYVTSMKTTQAKQYSTWRTWNASTERGTSMNIVYSWKRKMYMYDAYNDLVRSLRLEEKSKLRRRAKVATSF